MSKSPKKDADERTPKEAEKVRDATLRTMLQTPPKPHKDEGGKKPKRR